MADVNKLKLTRRNTKGQLTRTLTTINDLVKEEVIDLELVKKFITKAERQFEKLEEKHSELMEVIEEQMEFEDGEKWMGDCESQFVQIILHARQVVNDQSQSSVTDKPCPPLPTTSQPSPTCTAPTQPVSTGTVQATSSNPTHTVPTKPVSTGTVQAASSDPTHTVPTKPVSTGTVSAASSAALPTPPATSHPTSSAPKMARMKFPTFSGNIRDYKRFKELFIHCSAGLTEIECFYQLTESMVNAKERNRVKGCINVTRAWQVLDEYYGDSDKIVDSLLRDLDNLKTYEIKGRVNLPAMSRFVQTLQIFETHAEAIGLSGELNSKIMLSQIKQKLPEEHRIAYEPCGDAPVILPDQLRQYEHLSQVHIHVAPSQTIDLLLGVDNTHLMIWEDYICGEKFDEPVAVRCPLGWFIQGGRSTSSATLVNYVNVSAIGPLEEFLGLEAVGLDLRDVDVLPISLTRTQLMTCSGVSLNCPTGPMKFDCHGRDHQMTCLTTTTMLSRG
ncbi:uncharacterized protein LOC119733704 [Patiria miniata]|uniref:Uncharacterized protein n=1 Tax=Patiria miniata TaxID=46514 RepID=A0A914AH20_PATMI|nr:uncharacterized protein LOC119733704 [Patiria miniata]